MIEFTEKYEGLLLKGFLTNFAQSLGWTGVLGDLDQQLGCKSYLCSFHKDGRPSEGYTGADAAQELATVLTSYPVEGDASVLWFLLQDAEINHPYVKQANRNDGSSLTGSSGTPQVGDLGAATVKTVQTAFLSVLKRSEQQTVVFACLFNAPADNAWDMPSGIKDFRRVISAFSLGINAYDRYQSAASITTTQQTILARLSCPTVIVDANRKILAHTNTGLEALHNSGLASVHEDALIIHDRQFERYLQFSSKEAPALNSALTPEADKQAPDNNMASAFDAELGYFTRDASDRPLRIHIEHLGNEHCWAGQNGTEVILIHIFLSQPLSKHLERLLQEEFGLSQSEAHLAYKLTEIGSVADTSAYLGITRNTAKTHLRRIFEKTGLHTQLQLSRLIHELSSVVQSQQP